MLGDSPRVRFAHSLLIVMQTSLAVTLFVCTGLLLRNLARFEMIDLGITTENRVQVTTMFAANRSLSGPQRLALQTQVFDALESLQAVEAVALKQMDSRGTEAKVAFPDRPEKAEQSVRLISISDEYRQIVALPLLAGRGFAGFRPGELRRQRDYLRAKRDEKADLKQTPGEFQEVSRFSNMGRSTPEQCLSTTVWAANSRDMDVLRESFYVAPEIRAEVVKFLNTLPKEQREQFATPEELIGLAFTQEIRNKAEALAVSGTTAETDGSYKVITKWRSQNGAVKPKAIPMQRSGSGWKIIIPKEMVDDLPAMFDRMFATPISP